MDGKEKWKNAGAEFVVQSSFLSNLRRVIVVGKTGLIKVISCKIKIKMKII